MKNLLREERRTRKYKTVPSNHSFSIKTLRVSMTRKNQTEGKQKTKTTSEEILN